MVFSTFYYYFRSLIYLLSRWLLRKKYMIAYTPKFNLHFTFKTEDAIGRHIYKRGIIEEDITHFITHTLTFQKGDIIFDIGANIGWHALLLNKSIPASATIYAFEPDPLNFSLLETNIKNNNASKIVAYQQAVSDKTGTQTLYLYPGKNRGRHSLLPINSHEQVQVSTTTLDTFVHENNLNWNNLKFIKIDVEGYEYVALSGAKKVLEHIPLILAEYSPAYMKKGNISSEDLLNLLYGYNFVPHAIEPSAIRELTRESILSQKNNINILWKKAGFELKR